MAIRIHSGAFPRRVCRHSNYFVILAFVTLAACNREKSANAAAETAAVPGDQPSVVTEPIADFKSIANRVVRQSAGGENRVNFGVSPEVPAATVTVDGTVLVKDGKLVAAPTMANR